MRLSALLLLLLAALGFAAPKGPTLAVGDKAPTKLPSAWIKGDRVSALDPKKTYVIEFWATWCGNCRELEPRMQAAQRAYAGRVAFVGVAVSVNQSPERVRRYVSEHLTGFTHFYDRRGDAVGDYDVPATSYVVVTDRTGKVVYTGLGGTQDIDAAIRKALR